MLDHRDRHHRQLFDLVARRLPVGHTLTRDQDMSAAATGRPVLDDPIDCPRRQQRPALTLMAGLRTLLAPRPILRALGPLSAPARRCWAAATSDAITASSDAQSCAIRSSCWATPSPGARSARPSATAPQRPHRDPGHRSLPPQLASHTQGSPQIGGKPRPQTDKLNAYSSFIQGRTEPAYPIGGSGLGQRALTTKPGPPAEKDRAEASDRASRTRHARRPLNRHGPARVPAIRCTAHTQPTIRVLSPLIRGVRRAECLIFLVLPLSVMWQLLGGCGCAARAAPPRVRVRLMRAAVRRVRRSA
jgi:hypothetical protein